MQANMSTAISFSLADSPVFPIHRFTVDQYHRLGELGLITPEDRVELLEGWIVKKMNQRPVHGYVVRFLSCWLQANLSDGFLVQCQLPITTLHSEPEPDLAIVRGAHADYRHSHPQCLDCRLVIEVADTSLHRDRAKAEIYASAGVEEYWIFNLADHQLERFQIPRASAYTQSNTFEPHESIELQLGNHTISLQLAKILDSNVA